MVRVKELIGKRCFRVDGKGRRISGLMVVSDARKSRYDGRTWTTVDLSPIGDGWMIRGIMVSRVVMEDDPQFDEMMTTGVVDARHRRRDRWVMT